MSDRLMYGSKEYLESKVAMIKLGGDSMQATKTEVAIAKFDAIHQICTQAHVWDKTDSASGMVTIVGSSMDKPKKFVEGLKDFGIIDALGGKVGDEKSVTKVSSTLRVIAQLCHPSCSSLVNEFDDASQSYNMTDHRIEILSQTFAKVFVIARDAHEDDKGKVDATARNETAKQAFDALALIAGDDKAEQIPGFLEALKDTVFEIDVDAETLIDTSRKFKVIGDEWKVETALDDIPLRKIPSKIESLEKQIETKEKAVAKLEGEIETLLESIETLRNRVEESGETVDNIVSIAKYEKLLAADKEYAADYAAKMSLDVTSVAV